MLATPSFLHVANLSSLIWLRQELAEDPQRAARLFSLGPTDAASYGQLSDFDIEALCNELDLSLFVPRLDGVTLPAVLAECAQPATEIPSSDLVLHNLRNLQALRDTCIRSPGEAVWAYRIDHDTANAYQCLEHASAMALCRRYSRSVLVPRYEASVMTRILDKPPGAKAIFAAAYEMDVAVTGEAARRFPYLAH